MQQSVTQFDASYEDGVWHLPTYVLWLGYRTVMPLR